MNAHTNGMTAAAITEPETATRLNGNSKTIVTIVVYLVSGLALTSFIAGAPGLYAIGQWALLPGVLAWAPAILLDGGMVVFSLVAVVRRARHETVKFALVATGTLTVASVSAQVAHVLVGSEPTWQAGVGAALAALFPLIVFAASHSLLDLAIAPAPHRAGKRPVKRQPAAPAKVASTIVAKPATRSVAKSASLEHAAPATKPGKEQRLAQVLELHRTGLSQRQIALQTGVSRPTVSAWLERATA